MDMSNPQPYRILITGSRDWQDVETIQSALDEYNGAPNVVLITGSCPTGADYLCEIYAKTLGWEIESHPANWKRYGRAAGPMRNAEMVVSRPHVCLVFIKPPSKGAANCASLAQTAGIKTHIFNEQGRDGVMRDAS